MKLYGENAQRSMPSQYKLSGAKWLADKYSLTPAEARALSEHPQREEIIAAHDRWLENAGWPATNSPLSRGMLLDMMSGRESVGRRRYTVNRDSVADARKLREKFRDEPATKETAVPWQWPRAMQEVGTCESVMYVSDKWPWQNKGQYVDYKHVAEGPQTLFVRTGFIREYSHPAREIEVSGPSIELRDMPNAFAVLADILGVQTRLYEPNSRKTRQFSKNADDGYYQIDIAGAKLGGAKHPRTGETFLFIYTSAGVHCLITGRELDVEKDGIVG